MILQLHWTHISSLEKNKPKISKKHTNIPPKCEKSPSLEIFVYMIFEIFGFDEWGNFLMRPAWLKDSSWLSLHGWSMKRGKKERLLGLRLSGWRRCVCVWSVTTLLLAETGVDASEPPVVLRQSRVLRERTNERKTAQARPEWVEGSQSSSRAWALGLCYRCGAWAQSAQSLGHLRCWKRIESWRNSAKVFKDNKHKNNWMIVSQEEMKRGHMPCILMTYREADVGRGNEERAYALYLNDI